MAQSRHPTTASGRKRCRGCKKYKSTSKFFRDPDAKGQTRSRCKQCYADDAKAWRLANPARHREIYKQANHRANLKNRFGLTVEQFDLIWKTCDGRCAICQKPETRARRLCLDHNHRTGALRGFICSRCNLMIGNADDDPDRLKKAALYLLSPPLRNARLK